jgi:MSHA pilin protein MshC
MDTRPAEIPAIDTLRRKFCAQTPIPANYMRPIEKIHGFTLVELIMVMIIIGILAVAVVPRMFDRKIYESRGFYDETLAALRYAQKSAIAQRRTTCVAFTSTTVTLKIVTAAGSTDCNTASGLANLVSPTGASPFTVTAKPGVAFSVIPNGVSFYASGQASNRRTIQVAGVAGIITVEQATGYVHQ